MLFMFVSVIYIQFSTKIDFSFHTQITTMSPSTKFINENINARDLTQRAMQRLATLFLQRLATLFLQRLANLFLQRLANLFLQRLANLFLVHRRCRPITIFIVNQVYELIRDKCLKLSQSKLVLTSKNFEQRVILSSENVAKK